MQRKRYGMMAIVVLMVILLSGCFHVRQEVTLKADDNWEGAMEIRFPASAVEQIGEEQLMMSQEDMEEGMSEAEARGVQAEFEMRKEDNGDVVWRITYSGQGLELLNSALFEDVIAFTADESGRVKFYYDPGEITEMTSMGGSYTFVLNAGKVHSSNATEKEGNTLIWENPTGPLEAEVEAGAAGGGLSVGIIILLVVLGLVVIIVVVVLLLYLRGKQAQAPAAAPVVPPPAAPAAPPPAAPAAPPSEPVAPSSEPPAPPQA
jgi:uncharacterized membrane protein